MKENQKKILDIALPLITLICIIVLWTVASISVNSKYVLPSVKETFIALIELTYKASFFIAFFLTLLRCFVAFLISFVLAFIFAILTEKFYVAKKIIMPIIGIMRALPTVAVVLLLLFWTNSEIAPIIVTMLVVLPTIFNGIVLSLKSIDKDVLEMCKVFKVSKKETYKKVIIPGIMPSLLITMGSGLSLNLKLMVAAEVLASTAKSLGGLFNYTNANLQTATMLALVVLTVLVGLLIEKVFSLISHKVGKWQ